jgi:hypothetical protein
MTMPRNMRIILVIAVNAIVMGLMPSAWSCSCVGGMSSEDYLEQSAAAFVGVARDREVVTPSDTYREEGETRYAFDVERTLKGQLGAKVDVSSSDADATCGFRFTVGHRYRVYLHETESGGYATGLCSGNEDLGPAGSPATPVAEVTPSERATGRSRGGTPTPTPVSSPSGPSGEPTVGGVAVGDKEETLPGSEGGTSLAVALGILTLGIGGGAILLTLRRRRL